MKFLHNLFYTIGRPFFGETAYIMTIYFRDGTKIKTNSVIEYEITSENGEITGLSLKQRTAVGRTTFAAASLRLEEIQAITLKKKWIPV